MSWHGVDVVDAHTHEAVDDVNGHGEDDGRVVLCRDAVQCLKIPQLKLSHSQKYLANSMFYDKLILSQYMISCLLQKTNQHPDNDEKQYCLC